MPDPISDGPGSSRDPFERGGRRRLDPVDPLVRGLATPATVSEGSCADPPPNAVVNGDAAWLAAALVRRLSWGGRGKRGTARIEIGEGELAGCVLTVRTDGDDVEVDVVLPAGVPAADLEDRLSRRLEQRGLRVRALRSR